MRRTADYTLVLAIGALLAFLLFAWWLPNDPTPTDTTTPPAHSTRPNLWDHKPPKGPRMVLSPLATKAPR